MTSACKAQPAALGQWSEVFPWRNVGIHLSVMPNGKVLYWSRREGADLDEQSCVPRLWDPTPGVAAPFTDLPRPKSMSGK
jgi:hypothetical protein